MQITLPNEDFRELRERLDRLDANDDIVNYLLGGGWLNNGDIARISGLHTSTVRRIRDGVPPTKAQRAALKYVALTYWLNLEG